MAEVKWTDDQRNAIESSGGSLLVSAAAGSGKTAVLAQRVIRQITGPHPVDADRLLVVTFSNAAAGEMRQRIARKLWELAEQNPGDRRLARQQLLLDSAQISTIHSFCIHLLRSHFHLLELPADFRIGDEHELEVLRSAVARAVISQRYENGSPAFLDMVELLASSRSDSKVEAAVKKLYGFVRNHPFYQEWLDKSMESYRGGQPLEQSPWYGIIMDYAKDALRYCKGVLLLAINDMTRENQIAAAYQKNFKEDLHTVERCLAAVETGGWDNCRSILGSVSFGTLGRLVGYPDEERKKRFQSARNEVKDLVLKTLRDKVFYLSSEDYSRDMELLCPIVAELFDTVLQFDRELSAAKLQRKLLDFGDLEHYTLRLLYDSKDGVHTPSRVAIELRERYHEIFIDEYQDTNGTQEMIFRAITNDRGNQFLVGDVKQSIYRFRQARPENFLEKKSGFSPYDGSTFPAKISLNANFRTRRETTGMINYIFGMVMSRKIGEMEYGEEDELRSAGSYDYTQPLPVQFLVTDPGIWQEDSAIAEPRVVAAEIKRLLDEGTSVSGKEGMRPITPGDICILLRSRSKADRYAGELERLGVRCWSDRQESFLESREVAPVVSYLKALANPLLDLELSQVLCSYLYGFTSEMLAQLRLEKCKSLFAALLQRAENDKDCAAFREDFELLRRELVCRPASEVLRLIYSVTKAEQKALAMSQGEGRRANLRLLMEQAASYGGGADFSGFLGYLYSLEEYGCDLPSATVTAGNAVSVMSIHKSKGLEFPVVFLCDTAAQFNTMDLAADMLLSPELGIACVARDNRTMTQHRTIPLVAMSLENRRAMLSEELRILYVALTRARERLYITAGDKKLAKLKKAAAAPLEGGRVSGWSARTAGSMLDWIAAALCHHPDFPGDLLEQAPEVVPPSSDDGKMTLRTLLPQDIPQLHATGGGGTEPEPDEEEVIRLRRAMRWEYPFAADTVTPVKMSVSQLSKEQHEGEYYFTRRLRLLTRKKLTPTERGVAAHKFMQFADYPQAAADPDAEVARLTKAGFLTQEEGRELERSAITAFFLSGIGRRTVAAREVYREIRFMREFTPEEMSGIKPGCILEGNTVVQGVADCVIIENGAGTIIDYKTDHVKSMDTLLERYTDQLRLYRYILEELLEVRINKMVLWSFALGQGIEVENNS